MIHTTGGVPIRVDNLQTVNDDINQLVDLSYLSYPSISPNRMEYGYDLTAEGKKYGLSLIQMNNQTGGEE